VDIALISNTDENIENIKEIIYYASSFGPEIVLVTRGEQGAILYDGNKFYHQPIVPIKKIVDTLGAGDAFLASFMVDYLSEISLEIALENAAKSAAKTCSFYGAFGHGAELMRMIE